MKHFSKVTPLQIWAVFVVLTVLIIAFFGIFSNVNAQTSGSSTAEACLTSCGLSYQTCAKKAGALSSSAKSAALDICETNYKKCNLTCYPPDPTNAKSWDSVISEVLAASSLQEAVVLAQRYGLTVNYEHGDGIETAIVSNPITGETIDTMVQYMDDFGSGNDTQTNTSNLTPSTKFSIGLRVQATDSVNVRVTASSSGTLLGTEPVKSTGTVVAGPVSQGGFNWWQIKYDNGLFGWSIENYLTAPVIYPPTVIFAASSTYITLGNSFQLTWASSNTTSCTASGKWTGTQATSGIITQTPATNGVYNYTITCNGTGGSVSSTVTVTVAAAPKTNTAPGGTKTPGKVQQSFNNLGKFFSSLFTYGQKLVASLTSNINPFKFTAQVSNSDTGNGTTGSEGSKQCQVAGSSGKANIFVDSTGIPDGLKDNYSISTTCYAGVSDALCSLSRQASASATSWADGLGGVKSEYSGVAPTHTTLKISIASSIDSPATGLSFVQSTDKGQTAYITIDGGVINDTSTECHLSSSQTESLIRYIIEHETLHTFGIAHTSLATDLMSPTGGIEIDKNTETWSCQDMKNKISLPPSADPSEIQALRDIAQGKYIPITDDGCIGVCEPGQVYSASLTGSTINIPQGGGAECVDPKTLCGPNGTLGSSGVFSEQTQKCEECPSGSVARDGRTCIATSESCSPGMIKDYLGNCQPADAVVATCVDPNYEYDGFSNECIPIDLYPSDDGQYTYESDNPNVSAGDYFFCAQDPVSGICSCVDGNGNTVPAIPGACDGSVGGVPPVTGPTEPGLDGSAANFLGGGAAGASSEEDSLKAYCESISQDDPSCWSYYYPEWNDAAD